MSSNARRSKCPERIIRAVLAMKKAGVSRAGISAALGGVAASTLDRILQDTGHLNYNPETIDKIVSGFDEARVADEIGREVEKALGKLQTSKAYMNWLNVSKVANSIPAEE